MPSKTRKIGIALLILTQVALIVIWAINGYEETWFYVTLMLVSISTSWVHFAKKKDVQ
ncbi:MAG: hypothetical protein V4690_01975 [Patescibacteria group bacterium]